MFTSAMTLRLCIEIMQQISLDEKFEAYSVEKNLMEESQTEVALYSVAKKKKKNFSKLFFLNPCN